MGHSSSSCHLWPAELKGTRPWLPVRKPVTDVMVTKDAVQDCVVYMGRGSFHHGLSTTAITVKQANAWPARHIIHVRIPGLWDALPEHGGGLHQQPPIQHISCLASRACCKGCWADGSVWRRADPSRSLAAVAPLQSRAGRAFSKSVAASTTTSAPRRHASDRFGLAICGIWLCNT